ncbi:MAG: lipoyl(octanoyl) transferase LipB [Saprospiraceae bacterium]
MKPKVFFSWIEGRSYQEVWDIQTSIHKKLIENKLSNAKVQHFTESKTQEHQLLFCEHYPVFTLGKSGSLNHLLLSQDELESGKIEFFKINRGGDITYHGPGQITGYPIFDLDEFFTDVHKYVSFLEESIILLMAEYGLKGIRIPKFTGVWIAPDDTSLKFRKICAIGVHMSRWVSMHGFAFNVNTDMNYFDKIIPCGIEDQDKTVTSLAKELGRPLDIKVVGMRLAEILADVNNFELINK